MKSRGRDGRQRSNRKGQGIKHSNSSFITALFMEGKIGRPRGGPQSLTMAVAIAAWWVGRGPCEWEPSWGNLSDLAKKEVSSDCGRESSPKQLRESGESERGL